MPRIAPVLIIVAAALLLGNQSFAESFRLRVAFANVPGVEEIEAGNVQAGIKLLEDQLAQIELEDKGDLLMTLCAAYVIHGALAKAKPACDQAVEINPTKAAYNNRGVFRVHAGHLNGAREDFERVRPRQPEAYKEELIRMDALTAADNFDAVEQLLSKRNAEKTNASVRLASATVEDLSD